MINVNEIKSVDWSMKLGFFGEVVEAVDDIDQCIKIILKTRKGSVPLDPEFGCDIYKYLDMPLNLVIADITRETFVALRENEPRIEVLNVKISSIEAPQGSMQVKIEYKLKDSEIVKITEVVYER